MALAKLVLQPSRSPTSSARCCPEPHRWCPLFIFFLLAQVDELSSKAQTIINKYLDRTGDAKGRYSAFCAATGVVPWGLLDSDDYDALLEVRPATSCHSTASGSTGLFAPFLLHKTVRTCEKVPLHEQMGVCCTHLPCEKTVKMSQGKGMSHLQSPIRKSQLGFLTTS